MFFNDGFPLRQYDNQIAFYSCPLQQNRTEIDCVTLCVIRPQSTMCGEIHNANKRVNFVEGIIIPRNSKRKNDLYFAFCMFRFHEIRLVLVPTLVNQLAWHLHLRWYREAGEMLVSYQWDADADSVTLWACDQELESTIVSWTVIFSFISLFTNWANKGTFGGNFNKGKQGL